MRLIPLRRADIPWRTIAGFIAGSAFTAVWLGLDLLGRYL
jgi:hypothetical protein